jgi:hypothetical protein
VEKVAVKLAPLFALFLLAACQREPMTAAEAKDITDEWWKGHYSASPDSRLIVTTVDLGDKWRVTYAPDRNGAGGETAVVVDKLSRKIVQAHGTQ